MTMHYDDWRQGCLQRRCLALFYRRRMKERLLSLCFARRVWLEKQRGEQKNTSHKVTFLFVQLQLLTRKCQMPGKLMQGLGMVPPFTMVGQHSLAYPLSGDCL